MEKHVSKENGRKRQISTQGLASFAYNL